MKQIEGDSLYLLALGFALIGTSQRYTVPELVVKKAKAIATALTQDEEILRVAQRLLDAK